MKVLIVISPIKLAVFALLLEEAEFKKSVIERNSEDYFARNFAENIAKLIATQGKIKIGSLKLIAKEVSSHKGRDSRSLKIVAFHREKVVRLT
jgi:hypothetical protein